MDLYFKVYALSALVIGFKYIVLAGEYSVQEYAGDGGHSQTGAAYYTNRDRADTEVDTNGQNKDYGSDYYVSAVCEVYLILNYVSYTDSGYHTVEDEGDTAHSGRRHRGDECREFR